MKSSPDWRRRWVDFRRGSRGRWRRPPLLAGIGLAVLALSAAAQESNPAVPAFALRGFGTLGVAHSSSRDAEFIRDISQPNGVSSSWSGRIDSILGLQANYRANEAVELVLQGVSHYRYNATFSPELTWAFIKYDPTPSLSFRLGRIGTEFLMQSDSRMVGYSYLPVRPPVDFFGGVPFNYGDGLDAQWRHPVGEGVVRLRLAASVAREKLPPYNLNGARIREASLGYENGPWQVRYNYAQAHFAQDIESLAPLRAGLAGVGATAAAQAIGLAGTTTRYQSLGLAYDDGNWQIQATTNSIRHDVVMFENARSSYLLAGYRFGSLSPFVGYSRTHSSPKSLDIGQPASFIPALSESVATLMRASHQDQHTTTLGLRWDFRRNMDLKAQVDLVHGTPDSIFLVANFTPGWNGRTNVFSLSLDFVF